MEHVLVLIDFLMMDQFLFFAFNAVLGVKLVIPSIPNVLVVTQLEIYPESTILDLILPAHVQMVPLIMEFVNFFKLLN